MPPRYCKRMFKYPFVFDILKKRKSHRDDRVQIHPPAPEEPPYSRKVPVKRKRAEDNGEVDFNIDNEDISLIILKKI